MCVIETCVCANKISCVLFVAGASGPHIEWIQAYRKDHNLPDTSSPGVSPSMTASPSSSAASTNTTSALRNLLKARDKAISNNNNNNSASDFLKSIVQNILHNGSTGSLQGHHKPSGLSPEIYPQHSRNDSYQYRESGEIRRALSHLYWPRHHDGLVPVDPAPNSSSVLPKNDEHSWWTSEIPQIKQEPADSFPSPNHADVSMDTTQHPESTGNDEMASVRNGMENYASCSGIGNQQDSPPTRVSPSNPQSHLIQRQGNEQLPKPLSPIIVQPPIYDRGERNSVPVTDQSPTAVQNESTNERVRRVCPGTKDPEFETQHETSQPLNMTTSSGNKKNVATQCDFQATASAVTGVSGNSSSAVHSGSQCDIVTLEHQGVQCEIIATPDEQKASIQDEVSQSSDPENDYRCQYCDIAFNDEVLHSIHMGCHSHCDPFLCNVCGRATANKYAFYTHIMRGHESSAI